MRPDVEEQEDAEHEGLKVKIPKNVFFYKDEERIFLLEEEKKKSGRKRKFLWFLVFWRILFIPLSFFFFSFSKIHW